MIVLVLTIILILYENKKYLIINDTNKQEVMLHVNINRKSRLKTYQMQDVTNFSLRIFS